MNYEIKSIPIEVTDMDTKSVKGYFSIFGNKDSDGDVITKNAFDVSLSQNYGRLKHLWMHSPMQPLSSTRGGTLKIYTDAKGLAFESKISETSWGKDVLKLYADNVVDEHSIGFQILKSRDVKGVRELTELKLWEGSTVVWGANPEARTVKSLLSPDEVSKKMDSVMKSLRSGKFENQEIFDSLEIYLSQLQSVFEKASQPVQKTVDPVQTQVAFLNSLFK